MKRTFIGLLVGAALGFVVGFLATKYLIIGAVPSGYVCVTIKNESGQHIKSIVLKRNSLNSIESNSLEDKAELSLTFKNGGEGTYSIVATFDNDSILKSQENYVEGGYKATETIFNDHVKTEYK